MTRDEFYVGYLPMPAGLRRFVRIVASGIVIVIAALAIIIASAMRSPGGGVWNTTRKTTLTGVFQAAPYPHLLVQDGANDQMVLLVGEGKVAASTGDMSDAQVVQATGHVLRRDGLVLLEVQSIIPSAAQDDPPPAPSSSHLRRITLRGEVLDPKCYAGAMKPGDGKPHKACATLCLRGGIPPVVSSISEDGSIQYHLLVDAGGHALTGDALERLVAVVGEPVLLSGLEQCRSGLSVLRVDPGAITRLSAAPGSTRTQCCGGRP